MTPKKTLLSLSLPLALAGTGFGQAFQMDQVNANDAALGDQLGVAIDLDGDTLIVGAWAEDGIFADEGAAYVFVRNGNQWIQEAKLEAPVPATTDLFGIDVSVDGDTAVVGAYLDDNLFVDQGSIYVFTRSGTTWSLQQQVFPNDAKQDAWFGGNCSLDGERVIVGAQFDSFMGGAYVFVRNNGMWFQEDKLVSNDLALGDRFGVDTAIDGNIAVVGACSDQDFGPDTGSAYIFTFNGTTWQQTAKILRNTPAAEDLFGVTVDIDDDRVIVGSTREGALGSTIGIVDIFLRFNNSWFLEDILTSPAPCATCNFGGEVAIKGDLCVVAAEAQNPNLTGAVYVYERQGNQWNLRQPIVGATTSQADVFGTGVSIDGTWVAVGAIGDDPPGGQDAGSGYVFRWNNSYTNFCFGDGGNPPGCSGCPCGNDASQGTIGGCINSNGTSGRLIPSGIPSVNADSLRFTATGLNPNTFGVLASANNRLPNAGPCPVGTGVVSAGVLDGLRCIGGDLRRVGARPTAANGSIGISTNGWGPPNGPPGGLIAAAGFTAGQTRQFMIFYREFDTSVCMTGQNTSNGVSVTFNP